MPPRPAIAASLESSMENSDGVTNHPYTYSQRAGISNECLARRWQVIPASLAMGCCSIVDAVLRVHHRVPSPSSGHAVSNAVGRAHDCTNRQTTNYSNTRELRQKMASHSSKPCDGFIVFRHLRRKGCFRRKSSPSNIGTRSQQCSGKGGSPLPFRHCPGGISKPASQAAEPSGGIDHEHQAPTRTFCKVEEAVRRHRSRASSPNAYFL